MRIPLLGGWRYLTERAHDPNPPARTDRAIDYVPTAPDKPPRPVPFPALAYLPHEQPDPRDTPLEFSLTQRERDIATAGMLKAEIRRRQQNRDDDAAALAKALELP